MRNSIVRFEDIVAWQKAKGMTNIIYSAFKECNDFSFRDQIRRASVSIMNNIAEGYERKGNKELRKFLFISKGSCGEIRSMLYIARDEGYISEKIFDDLYERSVIISKMIAKFISNLKP